MRPTYSKEFKAAVVARIAKGTMRVQDLSEKMGIPRGTLFAWWLAAGSQYNIHPALEARAMELALTNPESEVCKLTGLTEVAFRMLRDKHGVKLYEKKKKYKKYVETPDIIFPELRNWPRSAELRDWARTHKRKRLIDRWCYEKT